MSLGKGRGVIATKAQYSKYRIIFDIRHVWAGPKKDHPACVLFFCTNPAENEKPLDMLGAVQFMVPQGFHWDYRPGKNNSGNAFFTTLTKSKADQWQWSRVELLVDAESGTTRLAVAAAGHPAFELGRFKDPTAGEKGPFAIQMHNAGLIDEYANIAIKEKCEGRWSNYRTEHRWRSGDRVQAPHGRAADGTARSLRRPRRARLGAQRDRRHETHRQTTTRRSARQGYGRAPHVGDRRRLQQHPPGQGRQDHLDLPDRRGLGI